MNSPTGMTTVSNPTSERVSYIAAAKRRQHCQLCPVPIEAGEPRLVYAQGKRSWLRMHIWCALQSGRFQCKALENYHG